MNATQELEAGRPGTRLPRPTMVEVLDSRHLKTAQRRHAQAVVLLSALGLALAVGMLAAGHVPTWIDLGIFSGMFLAVGIGSTVGFHRHFTHRSFKAVTPVRVLLAVLGSMAMQGTVIFWVSLHRRHHQCSDAAGDPHSPHVSDQGRQHRSFLAGLWHSYIGWTFHHEVPNAAYYARDLIRDTPIARVNRHYFLCVALGLLIPAALGGMLHGSWAGVLSGLVWGGLIRIFVWHNMIWSITSVAHVFGRRDFDSGDASTNNLWLALPTLGESFHNNHHAFPGSALMGLKWWQPDLGGWVVLALEKLGLAWDVGRPSAELMEKKLVGVRPRRA
ncbi:acyl-CoA desaturase [Aquabacterium sp. A7-Y]|uniref:acyl-CoA desaturase n=1 Tax=Aquabacterium sp. A7-Y TaxID=1349605 RepID=UPI00223DB04C|nr:acyl-CoA desaturase [Aquabacterium sp. A7-Y]MCW7539728.1 acyl-CoA desaturase [Aquabacterium sp. A7-Y]